MKSLVVQSDPDVGLVLRDQLEADGHSVDTVNTGADALRQFVSNVYEVVLLDIRLRDLDGLSVLRQFKHLNSQVPLIVLTCYSHPETVSEVMNEGVFDYVVMPCVAADIKALLQRAVAAWIDRPSVSYSDSRKVDSSQA